MKKFLFLFFCSFYISSAVFSQSPLVKQWDKRYGGTGDDVIWCALPTADGGYILGGSSSSGVSGDKTQPNWDPSGKTDDYWVVKVDSLGNKQWDRCYGGTGSDQLLALNQTSDGGYILGGQSTSGIGGDKTESCFDTILNGGDFWVVKIDAQGNKQWDKRYGGTRWDVIEFPSIMETADGGYIFGGSSSSGISGNKTQDKWDTSRLDIDYWVVRTDSRGNMLWDRDYGGSQTDVINSLIQTADGGYLLGGTSMSGADGDKSQPNFDPNNPADQSEDCWLVKIDSSGDIEWDQAYGGSNYDILFTVLATPDGGYAFGGYSASPADGNKSQPSRGADDFWIVKVDANGDKQWDKRFGGAQREIFNNLSLTNDGGYLLSGSSWSDIGGDKTESNNGIEELGWMVKVNSAGVKQWDKTIYTKTPDIDYHGIGFPTKNGGYLFGLFTRSDTGGYKTQHNRDPTLATNDYWIIKFKDTTACVSSTAGTVTANPAAICSGGTSLLTVTGGSGGTQWQTSANGISFTNIPGATSSTYNTPNLAQKTWYRAEATGACGNDFSASFILNINKPVAGTITAVRDTICQGTSGTLALGGNSSNSIQWQYSVSTGNFTNNGPVDTTGYRTNPLQQTTYYRVIVGTGTCIDSSGVFTLYVPPALTASFTTTTSDRQVTFASSSIGSITSYYWDFGDGQTSTEMNPVHTFSNDTAYNVCLTIYDGSNCSYTFCREVDLTANGIATIENSSGLIVYPVPMGDKLHIQNREAGNNIEGVELYDVIGRVALDKNTITKTKDLELDVTSLPKGMYFLKIRTAGGDFLQKLIKQ